MEFNVKFKDYSNDLWSALKTTVEQVLENETRPIAAFDADGTLWDTDLGEAFFDFLITHQKVPLPQDPWNHYESLKAQHAPTAYLWLAQICQGQNLSTIQQWVRESVQALHPVPIFEPQKRLIEFLQKKEIDVYVVTASVKWAVEPGAALLGIPPDRVIGIETLVRDGLITDQQLGPISYRHGKVEALLARTQGKSPFFASGNSEGDQELLQSATHLRLAVSAAHQDDKLFRTETNLQKLAKSSGWLSHRFV
jgi:HAD superfamily phosphoserine phosphatase-like hydrolase